VVTRNHKWEEDCTCDNARAWTASLAWKEKGVVVTRFLAIDSGKGGIGKTTWAQNLAYILAVLGRKVALVDTDKQAMSSNLVDVDAVPEKKWYTLTDVIRSGLPLLDAMYQARTGLYVVPSDTNIEKAANYILVEEATEVMVDRVGDLLAALASASDHTLPWQEKEAIRIRDFKPLPRILGPDVLVRPEYLDYVIFDFGGDPGALGRAIRRIGSFQRFEIWAPVGLEFMPMQGFAQLALTVKDMFKRKPEQEPPIYIVPFKVNHKRDLTTKYLAELYFYYPQVTMRSVHDDGIVPTSQDVVPAQTLFEFSRSSRPTKEVFELALRVDGYTGHLEGSPNCAICQEIHEYVRQQLAEQTAQRKG